jgi:hypothetical protein
MVFFFPFGQDDPGASKEAAEKSEETADQDMA